MALYDVAGRQVRALLTAAPRSAGRGPRVVWDGLDATGRAVGTGTYWVRLASGGETTSRRITVVR